MTPPPALWAEYPSLDLPELPDPEEWKRQTRLNWYSSRGKGFEAVDRLLIAYDASRKSYNGVREKYETLQLILRHSKLGPGVGKRMDDISAIMHSHLNEAKRYFALLKCNFETWTARRKQLEAVSRLRAALEQGEMILKAARPNGSGARGL